MTDIPTKMSAAILAKYGPPKEAIQYTEDQPVPEIKKATEILIKVEAAGINPVEAKITAGNMALVSKLFMKLPCVLGADYSGRVVAKGSKVTEFEVGDEVFGSLHLPFSLNGTYAQYAIVNVNQASIAKKPANITHEQAASVGIASITAYDGIIKNGGIDINDTSKKHKIIVVGASGGVGSYGVQIAKAIGAEAVAICSGRNTDYVKNLGADCVVDYTQAGSIDKLVEAEAGTFDLVFDCVGGEQYYNQLKPLLKKKKGIYSSAVGPIEHIGSNSVGITDLAFVGRKLAYRTLFGSLDYKMVLHLPHSDYHVIAKWFETGKLHGTTESVYDLKDAAAAHEQLMTHRTVGKIVLKIPQ